MTRVKRGVTARARHKKILKLTKGHYGARHRLFKTANESMIHSQLYACRERRRRKRDFRRLWITRINAASRQHGMSYSKFMNGLKQDDVQIYRKILAHMAMNEPQAFDAVAEVVQQSLS